MGDSIVLGRKGDYELRVHCMHSVIDLGVWGWKREVVGHISIPWGVWDEVVQLARPDKLGEELVVGEHMKAYLSVTPFQQGVSLEAKSPEPDVFVELLIPWDVWEETVRWVNGPGKENIAAHAPGIVKKKEKSQIRKLSIR